jgi:hypothetical protein
MSHLPWSASKPSLITLRRRAGFSATAAMLLLLLFCSAYHPGQLAVYVETKLKQSNNKERSNLILQLRTA